MPPAITVEEFPLSGVPEYPPTTWWGSSLAAPLGKDQLWFSMPTGSAATSWLYIFEPATGAARRGARLAGDFRHAVRLPSGNVAVLATYGLHEVTATGTEIRRTRSIPKYCNRLLPLFDGRMLALSWVTTADPAKSVPLVDVARWQQVARKRFPSIDHVVDGSNGAWLWSLGGGAARRIAADLTWDGPPTAMPLATSAAISGSRGWCTPARLVRAENVSYPSPPDDYVMTLEARDIAEVDLHTGDILRSRQLVDSFGDWAPPPAPIRGIDHSGRLVIVGPGNRATLLNPDDLSEVASVELLDTLELTAFAPPDVIWATTSPEVPRSVVRIAWDDSPQ